MKLNSKLKEIKAQFESAADPKVLEIMQQASRDLDSTAMVDRALGVESRAPQFTLNDERGVGFALTGFISRGPLLLHFFRGFWCPYCNAELEALQAHHAEITAGGVTLVSISPMHPKYVQPLKNKYGLTFPMLLDPHNLVAEQFGLVYTVPEPLQKLYLSFGIDLPRYNDDDSWQLPMPARFLIDQKGVIRDAAVSVDHTDRPDVEKTLATLRKLMG